MKVYDGSSWGEVTSTGDFKYLFLCPAGGSGAPTLNGSIATYDLRESSNSGSAASVSSAAQLIVSINGVIQKANTGTSAPAEGFALVDANTIIFGANLASGDSVFIVQIGSAVSIPTPGDGTVSAAKIASGAVTTAKIADANVTAAKLASGVTDLSNDTSPQLGGDLDSNGNNIKITDGEELRLGDGNDLVIKHDGSHSYINDNGTGNLYLSVGGAFYIQNQAQDEALAIFNENGACEIYHDNSKKLQTDSDGVEIFGNRLRFADDVKAAFGSSADLQIHHTSNKNYINAQTGNLAIQRGGTTSLEFDGNGDLNLPDDRILGIGSGADLNLYHNGTDSYIKNNTNGGHLRITNVNSSKAIVFATSDTNRFQISDNGHLIPSVNNTHDLGDASYRWRNVYTNDLHLSNEGSSNDVDGTWGDWTIQEGESDLFLKNNRSGKKYKFNLTEVS